jgi:alpha-glucosidase (family GH31 glycosyl hydrolase)
MPPSALLPLLAFLAACDDVVETDDTGTPPDPEALWPEWAWMPWAWETEPTQASTLALVEGYQSRGIPLGAVILDAPWATYDSTFAWDTTRFPDPQGLVDDLHASGVAVLLWVSPGIDVDAVDLWSLARKNGWFMQENAGSGPGVIDGQRGQASLLDYFDASAVAWWHSLWDPILDMGIDGWRCEGLDAQVSLTPYSPSLGRAVERSEYSEVYYRDFFDHTREVLGDERIISARPVDNDGYGTGGAEVAYAPRDITWAGWVGDQDGTFGGLEDALDNMYWSAESGYLAFGPDIGGYREDGSALGRSREVFLRWAGVGAFSPVMENGGRGEHRPWAFDDEVLQTYGEFAAIHVALLPWMREASAKAFAEERSLFSFVDRSGYAWVLADDLFVSPITEDGTSFTVTFPEGDAWIWIFDTSQRFLGGSSLTLTVPYTAFPAFAREGSEILDLLPAR